MIRIIDDTVNHVIIQFDEPTIARWKGKGKAYTFDPEWLYIYDPERDAWNTYSVRWAHVHAIKYANQKRILNHLLEEARKKICHP